MSGDRWHPLTAAQRGIFFAHHLESDSTAYTTAEVVEFTAAIDPGVLRCALSAAYGEFEQLRTRFRLGSHGPEQQVLPVGDVALEVVDVHGPDEAEIWMAAVLARPLAPEAGEVTRTALLRLEDGGCWWFHASHHLVTDGFGFQLLARRVAALANGSARALGVPGVAELVVEDATLVDEPTFWPSRLRSMVPAEPVVGVAAAAPRAHRAVRELDVRSQTALAEAARRHQQPWTTVVTAALAAYPARLGDPHAEHRVGVPLANRTGSGPPRAAARTVCTAVNVLPIRVRLAEADVAAFTAGVAGELATVAAHPFTRQEDLAHELRRQGKGPLFGLEVNVQPFRPTIEIAGVTGRIRNLAAGPVEDTTCTLRGIVGRDEPIRVELETNPRLYSLADTERYATRLLRWLTTFAATPAGVHVADLAVLDDAERELVVHAFNRTERQRMPRDVGEAFRSQVAATPDADAVWAATGTWTYAELHDRARAIAARLGARPGVVGVCLPRSAQLVAAVHGIALAAGTYVPLDVDLPAARRREMIGAVGIRSLIAAPKVRDELGDDLDVVDPDAVHASAVDGPPVATDLDRPAYVLFTSGSTGRPKGVVVGHRAIDNRLAWMTWALPIGPGDTVLHKTPVSFDVSVWELLWPLRTGARMVVADAGAHRDPYRIAQLLVDERVTVVHFVPAMLRAFLGDRRAVDLVGDGGVVRHLICSGEALTRDLVERARAAFGVHPVNLYGPTEAAIDVTAFDCATEPMADPVPIGRPVWNTRAYVLDARRRPVPVGHPGELYLAGVQLADGYQGSDELTAAAFVADPFHPGERMYRTGDRASWREDGVLRYHGRVDDQVKIRGQRIEPAEVEAILSRHTDVAEAAVVARPGMGGALALVAFVVLGQGRPQPDLRAWLAERTSDAAVPERVVFVGRLPRSTSGKIDRSVLRVTELPAPSATETLPDSLIEQRLCRAASEVLGMPCGPQDDFFDLGGNSLLALRLLRAIEDGMGIRVGLGELFDRPTPRGLAAVARAASSGRVDAGELAPALWLRRSAPGRAPIVALPPAGGLGWCYTSLLSHLPPGQGLLALQSPGLDGRAAPEPDDLDAWAAGFLDVLRDEVDGPFHLLGWSIGAMGAHALAAQALARGLDVGVVGMMDGYPARQWRHVRPPDESEALRGILRIAGIDDGDEGTLDRARTIALLRASGSALAALPDETIDASIGWVVTSARLVRTATTPRLDHDVIFWRAAAPRSETWLDASGWREHVTGRLHIVDVTATHAALVTEPHIGMIAAGLLGEIEAWRDAR